MKKKHIKKIVIALSIIPGAILLYIACIYLFSIIPVNTAFQEKKDGIEIFVHSNGVHTDIVVPVKTEQMDWTTKIYTSDFKNNGNEFKYISFGWGDKGFYLYTPTWDDLKFSTAFKAMFWLSSSAMHVSYHEHTPSINEKTRKIRISKEQYQALIDHIDQSFRKDTKGSYELINCCHYNDLNDNFYEGIGTYNLFQTCNCWTNNGLKKAGITTALWGPLEWSIMYHLK